MKCSFLTIPVLALGCILGGGGRAPAQYSPNSQPAFNPYLNLFRQGGTIGQNYYTLVRPDLNARAGINNLQQQTQANQQLITGLQSGPAVVTTGQPFGFSTHLGYFQNQLRGGGQAGGAQPGGVGTGGQTTFGLGGGGNLGGGGGLPPGR